MKCALLLPGHMRHYKNTFSNQSETIINPNNCDIFISTSNLITSWVKPHEYAAEEKDIETLEKEIRSVYGDRLKGLVINPEENVDVIPSPLQWKRLKECFEQKTLYEKENDFQYDAVIRARTDLTYSRPLKINKEDLKDNKVSLVRHFDRKIPVHDQFAYGHPESMRKYCELISVFAPRDVGGRSEEQLYRWLTKQNIDIQYMNNFYFKMMRGRE
jgi:hypothetical protein